jgi:hypothetical protein
LPSEDPPQPPRDKADAADGVHADIWIASDGNPLMAVESLRTVHEGRISPEIAQTAARMPLPDRFAP